MKSTGARTSNELQWLDIQIGHQDSNGCQGNMPYYIVNFVDDEQHLSLKWYANEKHNKR